MHRFRTNSSLRALFQTALLLVILLAVLTGSLVTFATSVITGERKWALLSLALLFLLGPLLLGFRLTASQTHCPLCLGSLYLAHPGTLHRETRALAGSYRAHMTAAILTTGSFRCPHCHEPVACQTRAIDRRASN